MTNVKSVSRHIAEGIVFRIIRKIFMDFFLKVQDLTVVPVG